MGRMHAPGKGISQSALPYRRTVPSWLKINAEDVKEQIKKLRKNGFNPLQNRYLKPDIPEDLYHMIKKAIAIRKHLERNRKDKDGKFRLILVESRIHRFARYYKTKSVLPPN
ncbi:40S ribosomal protein S13 [Lucilia cuprina]|uniref:Small ribosomal subunit protein uS15 n=1 Tax=Lucilia cuprina TaxID=7375 RepID=A0A0L0CD65_LUCCU|nr:40S ribosomal protein S13 [Lucilia cuprina]KNC30200.1 40S ribosomal protein S13 [Lucilia cuprina]